MSKQLHRAHQLKWTTFHLYGREDRFQCVITNKVWQIREERVVSQSWYVDMILSHFSLRRHLFQIPPWGPDSLACYQSLSTLIEWTFFLRLPNVVKSSQNEDIIHWWLVFTQYLRLLKYVALYLLLDGDCAVTDETNKFSQVGLVWISVSSVLAMDEEVGLCCRMTNTFPMKWSLSPLALLSHSLKRCTEARPLSRFDWWFHSFDRWVKEGPLKIIKLNIPNYLSQLIPKSCSSSNAHPMGAKAETSGFVLGMVRLVATALRKFIHLAILIFSFVFELYTVITALMSNY